MTRSSVNPRFTNQSLPKLCFVCVCHCVCVFFFLSDILSIRWQIPQPYSTNYAIAGPLTSTKTRAQLREEEEEEKPKAMLQRPSYSVSVSTKCSLPLPERAVQASSLHLGLLLGETGPFPPVPKTWSPSSYQTDEARNYWHDTSVSTTFQPKVRVTSDLFVAC